MSRYITQSYSNKRFVVEEKKKLKFIKIEPTGLKTNIHISAMMSDENGIHLTMTARHTTVKILRFHRARSHLDLHETN